MPAEPSPQIDQPRRSRIDATATDGTVRSPRIIGLDIARAFAIIGMVIVNFKITMGAEEGGPPWASHLSRRCSTGGPQRRS